MKHFNFPKKAISYVKLLLDQLLKYLTLHVTNSDFIYNFVKHKPFKMKISN